MYNGVVYLFLFFLLPAGGNAVMAQGSALSQKRQWSVEGGGYWVYSTVIDHPFSSLSYSGGTPGAGLLASTTGRVASHFLELFYTAGDRTNAANAEVQDRCITAAYSQGYELTGRGRESGIGGRESGISVKAGPLLKAIYSKRTFDGFVNVNSSYEFTVGIGAALFVFYRVEGLQDRLSFSGQMGIPVVNYLRQPLFAGEADGNEGKVAGPGSFLDLNGRWAVHFAINTTQQISVNYIWEYYQVRTERKVESAAHRVGLAYNINF